MRSRRRIARSRTGAEEAELAVDPSMLSESLLNPVERSAEVLFGLIMVLTFTSSISVAEGGRAGMREVLVGAVGCNFAWGLVDAAMYLMANLIERARSLKILNAVKRTADRSAPAPGMSMKVAGSGTPERHSLVI